MEWKELMKLYEDALVRYDVGRSPLEMYNNFEKLSVRPISQNVDKYMATVFILMIPLLSQDTCIIDHMYNYPENKELWHIDSYLVNPYSIVLTKYHIPCEEIRFDN